MKEKILAAIKAKFPKVNLSKPRLNAIADRIEKTVIDDETKIDAALDAFNDFNPLAELAKQDDTMRDLQGKLKIAALAKKDDESPKEEKVELPEDTPSWAKALLKQNETLSTTLAALQGKEVANTIKAKATELLKDIPVSYWGKRAIPEKVEDLDAFIEDVNTDYTTFTQDLTNKGLLLTPKPVGGNDPAKKEAVDPAIKAYVEKEAAKTTAAVPAVGAAK